MSLSRESTDPVLRNSGMITSWKGIADYFGYNVRTVRRWEQERGLPVRRIPGRMGGTVFAYAYELDAWLESRDKEQMRGPSQLTSDTARYPGDVAQNHLPSSAVSPLPAISAAEPEVKQVFVRRWQLWVFATVTVLIFSAALFWQVGNHQSAAAITFSQLNASKVRPHVPAPGAEELYLRGRYFWNLRTADGLVKAIDFYTQAIVKDPSYAEAYAGLAETYDLMPQFGRADLGDSFTKAEAAADRAITLNPNFAAAHTAKAFALFFWDWDIAGSDAEFRKALALDPNSALTHQWYASTLQGRLEGPECLKQIDEALRLNPASAAIASDAAYFHASFGDFDAGVRSLKEMEQTQPTLSLPAWLLEDLDLRVGDNSAYVADARRYASITRREDDLAMADAIGRGWTRANRTGLLEARARVLKAEFDHGTEPGFLLGETLVLLGRQKEALPYFRASLNKHYIRLITADQCPWANKLSRDPNYAALFKQVRERLHGNDPAHPPLAPIFLRLPS